MADWKRDLLASLEPFSGCTARQLDDMAALATELRVPAGAVLCQQGEIGIDTYVLVAGRVAVSIDGTQVATLGPGEFVGEMALLHDGRRGATVTAVEPTHALVIAADEVDTMLASVPERARGYGNRPTVGPADPVVTKKS
jgi:CRP-like cAMP-binding protein